LTGKTHRLTLRQTGFLPLAKPLRPGQARRLTLGQASFLPLTKSIRPSKTHRLTLRQTRRACDLTSFIPELLCLSTLSFALSATKRRELTFGGRSLLSLTKLRRPRETTPLLRAELLSWRGNRRPMVISAHTHSALAHSAKGLRQDIWRKPLGPRGVVITLS